MAKRNRMTPGPEHQAYWAERFRLLEQARHEAGRTYFVELHKQYTLAARQADKELAAWYQRFADAEGISLAQAKKKLEKNELLEFRLSVEEYIAKGKTLNYTQEWAKTLERASTRVHVSRLEALKLQLQQQSEAVYAYENGTFGEVMQGLYKSGFYKTAFELQKGMGIGFDLAAFDQNRLDKLLLKPWAADGLNFSQRIWRDRRKLMQELPTILTQAAIRGDGYKETSKLLARRFEVAESRAANLVATESAFFTSAGQRDCFRELGVEEYEVVATLDMKTSAVCRQMDGKHFPMGDFAPGITAPPFHGRCRSTTCPYFGDEFEAGALRAARNPETGETYRVPGDMRYPEWFEAFVAGGEKKGLSEIVMTFGLNFHEKGATIEQINFMRKAATETDKYYAITGLHCNGKTFAILDTKNNEVKKYTVKQLVGLIKKARDYDGKAIKLYACNAAAKGVTVAQELADLLGVDVKAPIDFVGLTESGQFVVIKNYNAKNVEHVIYEEEDGWKIIHPRKKK